MLQFGSSPRLRGTGLRPVSRSWNKRFIPAPAGNGGAGCSQHSPQPVHPRACGERITCMESGDDADGSSPRLRGTGIGIQAEGSCCRFIPAPAGNGVAVVTARPTTTVHPRACGERVFHPARELAGERFIPAPAGNGMASTMDSWSWPVHPRACGERAPPLDSARSPRRFIPAPAGNGAIALARKAWTSGSSPRLRGTATSSWRTEHAHRFIPAPAGNGKT